MAYKRPHFLYGQSEEAERVKVFDEWLNEQTQEVKEIVRLHVFNVQSAFTANRVRIGESAAKLIVLAAYLFVGKRQA